MAIPAMALLQQYDARRDILIEAVADHLFQRIILEVVLFFQHKNIIEVDT